MPKNGLPKRGEDRNPIAGNVGFLGIDERVSDGLARFQVHHIHDRVHGHDIGWNTFFFHGVRMIQFRLESLHLISWVERDGIRSCEHGTESLSVVARDESM